MEIIYKASDYSIQVVFDEKVSFTHAVLFNKATRNGWEFSIVQVGDATYNLTLPASETTGMDVGMYNLELWSNTTLLDSKENFAKVVETSKSN